MFYENLIRKNLGKKTNTKIKTFKTKTNKKKLLVKLCTCCCMTEKRRDRGAGGAFGA